jgi:hypothetical protein
MPKPVLHEGKEYLTLSASYIKNKEEESLMLLFKPREPTEEEKIEQEETGMKLSKFCAFHCIKFTKVGEHKTKYTSGGLITMDSLLIKVLLKHITTMRGQEVNSSMNEALESYKNYTINQLNEKNDPWLKCINNAFENPIV